LAPATAKFLLPRVVIVPVTARQPDSADVTQCCCMPMQVNGRCFELDKKSLIEPMLNMWISVVNLAGCAAGSFKMDFDRQFETDTTDGKSLNEA